MTITRPILGCYFLLGIRRRFADLMSACTNLDPYQPLLAASAEGLPSDQSAAGFLAISMPLPEQMGLGRKG